MIIAELDYSCTYKFMTNRLLYYYAGNLFVAIKALVRLFRACQQSCHTVVK